MSKINKFAPFRQANRELVWCIFRERARKREFPSKYEKIEIFKKAVTSQIF